MCVHVSRNVGSLLGWLAEIFIAPVTRTQSAGPSRDAVRVLVHAWKTIFSGHVEARMHSRCYRACVAWLTAVSQAASTACHSNRQQRRCYWWQHRWSGESTTVDGQSPCTLPTRCPHEWCAQVRVCLCQSFDPTPLIDRGRQRGKQTAAGPLLCTLSISLMRVIRSPFWCCCCCAHGVFIVLAHPAILRFHIPVLRTAGCHALLRWKSWTFVRSICRTGGVGQLICLHLTLLRRSTPLKIQPHRR